MNAFRVNVLFPNTLQINNNSREKQKNNNLFRNPTFSLRTSRLRRRRKKINTIKTVPKMS